MSPGCERIDLRALEARPWKNGAGLTRELAVHPPGASLDSFDWRISVAEITRDAPFSAFDGVDRCIVLLRGAGMRLRSSDGALNEQLNQRHRPFCFAGDAVVHASLIDGPCSDLNVMLRRGRCRADVTAHVGTLLAAAADAGMLLCADGAWRVELPGAVPIGVASQHAVLWREHMPPLVAHATEPASALLLVQIHALCQDRAT